MPKLQDIRKIHEIKLTTIEGGLIQVFDSLLASDIEVFNEISGKPRLLLMLSKLIKEWNLEGENGEVLPITQENIGKLDIKEINSIFSQINLTKDFLDKTL